MRDGGDRQASGRSHDLVGTIGVIGVGLIGGSIVRACLATGVRVLVMDSDASAVEQAARAGAVPAGLARLRNEADIVFICAPPAAVASLWEQWLETDAPRTSRSVVMDVSSVKAPVLAGFASRTLATAAADTIFMLSHPMAGRERSGWSAGDGGLFAGATWILCPPVGITGRELARSIRAVEAFGATVAFMDPAFHDHFAAVTSHVPHVLAFAFQRLVDELDPNGWRRFSGGSLRDVLRTSSSDPQLWTQILEGNADQLAPLVRRLADRLAQFDPTTDVASGQPRTPDEPAPVQLALPTDRAIDASLPMLLATGQDALRLAAWQVEDGQLRLELTSGAGIDSKP